MTEKRTAKRFIYYSTSQMILDDLTGYTYYGNKKICDLLNQVNDDSDKNAERYFDVREILRVTELNYDICREKLKAYFDVLEKYHIHTPEKLDQCLREGRVW